MTDVRLDLGLTQTGQGYKKNPFQRNQFAEDLRVEIIVNFYH